MGSLIRKPIFIPISFFTCAIYYWCLFLPGSLRGNWQPVLFLPYYLAYILYMWNLLHGHQKEKTCLYCFFFLIFSYRVYTISEEKQLGIFYFSLVLFALSLLSKAMAVPLAVVIVFLDIFYSRKFGIRLIWEKVPFFDLAIIVGIIAIQAQHVQDLSPENSHWTFLDRLALASHNFINYLIQLIAPHDLSVFYPYPDGLKFYHWLSFGLIILLISYCSYISF